MGMLDFLGRDTGEYVAGSLKQGGVGALGDIYDEPFLVVVEAQPFDPDSLADEA